MVKRLTFEKVRNFDCRMINLLLLNITIISINGYTLAELQ